MVFAYIASAIVAGLLIGASVLVIIWMEGRVTRGIRNRTVELVSVYDNILQEKSEKISEDEDNSTEKKHDVNANGTGSDNGVSVGVALRSAEKLGTTKYQDRAIADTYKLIRQSFAYDPVQILTELGAYSNPGIATELLEKLPYELIFRISTLPEAVQYQVFEECLNDYELKLLDGYVQGQKGFSAIRFYDYLTTLSKTEPSNARLWISPYAERRDFPGNVEVIVDEDICEGFQLEYDNTLFDYSVTKREIS